MRATARGWEDTLTGLGSRGSRTHEALPEGRTWWGQVGQGDAGRQVQLPQGLTTESLVQVRRRSQWKRGLLWSTAVGGAGKIFLSNKLVKSAT